MQELKIRDPQVVRLVEQLGEYYRTNISNRYIRPALLQLQLEKSNWDLIEALIDKTEQFDHDGFLLDELYRQIAAAAEFVEVARREVPNLRILVNASNSSGPERVMRDMAVGNFSSNLKVFTDLLNGLYIYLTILDKDSSGGHKPLYQRMPQLQDIGPKLVGDPG
ncbi:hypothetical protein FACS1894130_06010 [Spirochaetia bacterium]|nr:hypothetical protein FACS1894130_06010 [Spirochaetia bacterium]